MQKRKKNFLPRGMIKKTLLAMTFKIPLNRDFPIQGLFLQLITFGIIAKFEIKKLKDENWSSEIN